MLKEALIKQGKDAQWLAKKTKVSHQTVYNWMLGKVTPKPKHLLKISDALAIPMPDLFRHFYK